MYVFNVCSDIEIVLMFDPAVVTVAGIEFLNKLLSSCVFVTWFCGFPQAVGEKISVVMYLLCSLINSSHQY